MIVKKYTAATETEAALKAKEDLGAGAVVLNVKTIKQRGIAKLFKKNYVEITAALEEKENVTAAPEIKKQPVPDYQALSATTEKAIEKKLDTLHNLLADQIKKNEDDKLRTEEQPKEQNQPKQEETSMTTGSPSFSIIFWYTAEIILSMFDSFLSDESISSIMIFASFSSTSESISLL